MASGVVVSWKSEVKLSAGSGVLSVGLSMESSAGLSVELSVESSVESASAAVSSMGTAGGRLFS